MSLFKRPYVVIDTETTGLPPDADARPWEVAAVLIDRDGAEQAHISVMGRPEVWREDMARIVALGGVDPVEVRDSLPLAGSLDHVRSFILRGLDDEALLVAWNRDFDREMLARAGLDFRDSQWAPCAMLAGTRVMGAAGALPMKRDGSYKWAKLSVAAEFFGVPQQEPAHRALADARTTAAVMVAMAARRKA